MSFLESVLVALDNLRTNKLRTFLTMIGIVFGVGAVVTVVSIGQAGQASIVSEVSNYDEGYFVMFTDHDKSSPGVEIRKKDLEDLRKLEGIKYASTNLRLSKTSNYKKEKLNFEVTATTASYPKMQKIDMVKGRFFNNQEERARRRMIVVDQSYAEKVYGSVGRALGKKVQLDNQKFEIIGIFKPPSSMLGGYGGTTYKAYMPYSLAVQQMETEVDVIGMIEAVVSNPARLDEQVKSVRKWMARRHNTTEKTYRTQTSKDAQEMVASTFSILQVIIGSIAGVSLLVGGIGVMNIMLVSVTERTREIGIRKSIGATPGAIMLQFMIEAIVLSFLGGFIGILLGLGCAFLFSIITSWPFIVSLWAVFLAFGFSTAVGLFFGLYPANKASKLNPIEALRYE